MQRSRAPSAQTLSVLAALTEAGADWRHGYDIAAQAGLKSGTLYPLLLRLESQGYLEAQWQESPLPGRPPRHAYRLTARGAEFVRALSADPEAGAGRSLAVRPARS